MQAAYGAIAQPAASRLRYTVFQRSKQERLQRKWRTLKRRLAISNMRQTNEVWSRRRNAAEYLATDWNSQASDTDPACDSRFSTIKYMYSRTLQRHEP